MKNVRDMIMNQFGLLMDPTKTRSTQPVMEKKKAYRPRHENAKGGVLLGFSLVQI